MHYSDPSFGWMTMVGWRLYELGKADAASGLIAKTDMALGMSMGKGSLAALSRETGRTD
jgi:NaMN:DMB phosphoribosyltransferase